jgi:hypothetical protein
MTNFQYVIGFLRTLLIMIVFGVATIWVLNYLQDVQGIVLSSVARVVIVICFVLVPSRFFSRKFFAELNRRQEEWRRKKDTRSD